MVYSHAQDYLLYALIYSVLSIARDAEFVIMIIKSMELYDQAANASTLVIQAQVRLLFPYRYHS